MEEVIINITDNDEVVSITIIDGFSNAEVLGKVLTDLEAHPSRELPTALDTIFTFCKKTLKYLTDLKSTAFAESHFKGVYTSIESLTAAVPNAIPGDYAQVDEGEGTNVLNYNWDEDEGWVLGGGGGSLTPQSLGDTIHGCDTKSSPVDADEFVFGDSQDGYKAKRYTWVSIYTYIKTYLSSYFSASDHSHKLMDMTDDSDHRTATDTEKSTWNGKQNALGFTPENAANKNQNNGYCPLDSGGKVPAANLPATLMSLEGNWDANRNNPELLNGMANYDAGTVFECTTPGTVNFGLGNVTFKVGDWAVYGANQQWYKSINSNEVTGVNGQTGTVILDADDIDDTDTSHKFVSATEKGNIHASGSDAETNTTIGTLINGGAAITTPDDTDEFAVKNHTGGLLAKITWANIKTALSTWVASLTVTFTNKRITPRVCAIVSNANPTFNTDDYDCVNITAQAIDIASMTTNLSGTPTILQKLIIRIKDDGTPRAIAWGLGYEAKGVSLPTSTVTSKVTTCGFFYSTVTSKWGLVALSIEA